MILKIWTIVLILSPLPISSLITTPNKLRRPVLDNDKKDASFYRLPVSTHPLEYDIRFVINPELDFFSGEAIIKIKATQAVNVVVLHAYQLSFTRVLLKDKNGIVLPTDAAVTLDDRHFLNITLRNAQTLVQDEIYELDFSYTAQFTSYFAGAYKIPFLNQGVTRYLVATQFQSTYARDAFPCYDEPGFKAVFNLHIYYPPGFNAISNMDIIQSNQPPLDGYEVISFRSTPLMSTYLIGFVVSDLQYISNIEEENILYPREYKIYSRSDTQELLEYSLDLGQRAMEYLQIYMDTSYKIPKIDCIVLPSIEGRAMENWGMITYSEDFQFYKQGSKDSKYEKRIANVIGHMSSHFWLGNDVTPSWWDFLWLNEGFATFFEFYIIDKIMESEMRLEEQFVVDEMQNIMIEDSTQYTHPMTNPVGSPEEIDLNFDSIAFTKAGAVVRMMHHAFGELPFRHALASYLKKIPYGVTDPEILFEELHKILSSSSIIGPDWTISQIFGSWSNQSGYPILTVTPSVNDVSLILTQERFHLNASHHTDEKWWIPFTWMSNTQQSNSTSYPQLFPAHFDEYFVTVGLNSWYIANIQQAGYYRVMYVTKNWKNLIVVLKSNHTMFHTLNRAQLVDDSMMFSRTGRLEYDITLDLLNYLQKEYDYIPWVAADRGLNFLKIKMSASRRNDLYYRYVRRTVTPVYQFVGFIQDENDDHIERNRRNLILKIACEYEVPECWNSLETILSAEMDDPVANEVVPDLKYAAYCYGLKNGNRVLWNYVLNKYEKENPYFDRELVIRALSCSIDDDAINFFLNMIVSGDVIMEDDKELMLRSLIASGVYGIGKVLDFMIQNFLLIQQILISPLATYNVINDLGDAIVINEHIQKFNTFVTNYNVNFTNVERIGVDTALLNIAGSADWLKLYVEDVEIWLLNNV